MDIYDIDHVRGHLDCLLDGVQRGESFVIAKVGQPVARVTRIGVPPPGEGNRLGFLAGQIEVPDDFDRMG